MSDFISYLLIVANVLIGIALIILDYRYYRTVSEPTKWIKLAYALVGLYWVVIYFILMITPELQIETTEYGKSFIRPGITITLAVMCAGAIIRSKPRK